MASTGWIAYTMSTQLELELCLHLAAQPVLSLEFFPVINVSLLYTMLSTQLKRLLTHLASTP